MKKFTVIGLGSNGVDWSVEFFKKETQAIEWANELWAKGIMETVVIRDKKHRVVFEKK